MNKKKTLSELKKALASIESVIASIEGNEAPAEPTGICVLNGEPIVGRPFRGLCARCYSLLSARVRKGETTWEILESEGKCLPKGKSGRKPFDINSIADIKADARTLESEVLAKKKGKKP